MLAELGTSTTRHSDAASADVNFLAKRPTSSTPAAGALSSRVQIPALMVQEVRLESNASDMEAAKKHSLDRDP